MADQSTDASSPAAGSSQASTAGAAPQISLPKGGGAIRGIGEKFTANPVTGTGSLTVRATDTGNGWQVRLADGAGATGEEIIAWCRDRLSHFKCPKTVEFTGPLPRTTTGKVLKRELRSRLSPPPAQLPGTAASSAPGVPSASDAEGAR